MLEEEINEPDLSIVNVKEFGVFREDKYDDIGYTTVTSTEFAIIGFWKYDEDADKLKCYHMFRIPNPVKRAIRNSKDEQGCLYEVLFPGNDKDLLFFMEKKKLGDKQIDDKRIPPGFYFNCIDLDKIAANKHNKLNFTSVEILAESVKFDIQKTQVAPDSMLHKYLESFKLGNLNEDFENQRAANNPIFIAEDGGYKIIFHHHSVPTNKTKEDEENETLNNQTFELGSGREDQADETHKIYLYEFKEGRKETKDRFLAAAQILIGYSNGKIYYLTSEVSSDTETLLMKKKTSVNARHKSLDEDKTGF